MDLRFETLGNATILFSADDSPVLATDPWLKGTCYFGSWALDYPLDAQQIQRIQNAQYIWVSHGHPDHLHPESLQIIPKSVKFLIPDHYNSDIYDYLSNLGFDTQIVRYRSWIRLHDQLELLCLDNENQDAILVVRFGNSLIINVNDSPFCGEWRFLHNLTKQHQNDRVFLLQLCSIDADMRNFVDETGERIGPRPEELKPGAVREVARGAWKLGAKFFCCSSSQHLYVRSDSIWANEFRISWADMHRYWDRPEVELVPPFVTVDLVGGTYVENHPSHVSDLSQITDSTGDDDWDEALTAGEKAAVANFFRQFVLLKRYLAFIEVVVGSERLLVQLGRRFPGYRRRNGPGVTFYVPRNSLLKVVECGYFDDLLIGNFMRTQLHGDASLYPFVTPIIAKIGGNARVYGAVDYLRFRLRYLRRNPAGFFKWRINRWIEYRFLPWVRAWAARLNTFQPMKRFYRERLLNDRPRDERERHSSVRAASPGTRITWTPAQTPRGKWAPARPDLTSLDRPRLIVSVDTEEDFDWDGDFSRDAIAVDSIAQQEATQQLFERHGVIPIYLCDFPVAAQEAAYRVLRDWRAAGRCTIGAHLHPWVNPPQVEAVTSTNSYPCNLPLHLQREKLRILTETIGDNIGVEPIVYKAGRYGGDFNLSQLLKPLGYRIDMSINPIGDYSADGGPNQTMFPHAPFWLDPECELLAIPATANVLGALRGRWVSMAAAMRKDTSDRLRLGWLLRRFGMINRVFLSPEGTPLDEAKTLTRFLVASGHRVFTLKYHSTSLNPGSNPYIRDAADLRRFLGWIDAYLEFFFGEIGGVPSSATEIFEEARSRPVTLAVPP
jgi:Beta-lactamase superfamily domain